MRKERKHYTAEEKVAILRRHLLDKVPVSDLCEELGLQPTVFYRWQKEFFENGASAFQAKERPTRQVEEKQKTSARLSLLSAALRAAWGRNAGCQRQRSRGSAPVRKSGGRSGGRHRRVVRATRYRHPVSEETHIHQVPFTIPPLVKNPWSSVTENSQLTQW